MESSNINTISLPANICIKRRMVTNAIWHLFITRKAMRYADRFYGWSDESQVYQTSQQRSVVIKCMSDGRDLPPHPPHTWQQGLSKFPSAFFIHRQQFDERFCTHTCRSCTNHTHFFRYTGNLGHGQLRHTGHIQFTHRLDTNRSKTLSQLVRQSLRQSQTLNPQQAACGGTKTCNWSQEQLRDNPVDTTYRLPLD